VLPQRQSGPPDDLLDHGRKALIDLTLVDLRIALPDPALPGDPLPVTLGWSVHLTPPCGQIRLSIGKEANIRWEESVHDLWEKVRQCHPALV
jgi:hypothetical protein